MSTLDNKIKKVMSAVFEVPETEIDENTTSDSLENWDSIRHLNLIIALEEEFEISIPDEEVGNMVNYNLIKLVLNEQIK